MLHRRTGNADVSNRYIITYSMHGINDVLFLLSLAVRCQACLGQTIPERRVELYQTTSYPAIKYTTTTTKHVV
jgi:hypothetical protein